MALVSMRELLDHAATNGYGIPAFNVNNLEQVQAVMAAADEVGAPVILQASRGARSYAGDIMIRKMVEAAEDMYPQIPICLHQDHGNNRATCVSAMQAGFTSVMMDGSLLLPGDACSATSFMQQSTRLELLQARVSRDNQPGYLPPDLLLAADTAGTRRGPRLTTSCTTPLQ